MNVITITGPLRKTLFAARGEGSWQRSHLLFTGYKGKLTLVTTDNHRVSRFITDVPLEGDFYYLVDGGEVKGLKEIFLKDGVVYNAQTGKPLPPLDQVEFKWKPVMEPYDGVECTHMNKWQRERILAFLKKVGEGKWDHIILRRDQIGNLVLDYREKRMGKEVEGLIDGRPARRAILETGVTIPGMETKRVLIHYLYHGLTRTTVKDCRVYMDPDPRKAVVVKSGEYTYMVLPLFIQD